VLSLESAAKRLRSCCQEQLLAFYDQLAPAERRNLLDQISQIDFDLLEGLVRSHVASDQGAEIPAGLGPVRALPAPPRPGGKESLDDVDSSQVDLPWAAGGLAEAYRSARRRGRELISSGRVAALVVAGGDASRLGFAGPKGCLPATPVRRKPLFQVFAEQILATRCRHGCSLPWYVMTSPRNDAATRAFFVDNDFFGLDADDVFFFQQGWLPTVGTDGKILLAEKAAVAVNPDGHGGCLRALRRSGALDDMARRGIEHVSYFQVDNPLVRCLDPLFIGLHDLAGAEMSAKALPKRDPLEKLGNFCTSGGKVMVIEYSDLPDELAHARAEDGSLRFGSGSIAVHVFSRGFLERLTADGDCALPYHRAFRKVPHVGPDGRKVQPDKPNAFKFEMFIFDALPLARNVVVLQTHRGEEFSPIKNVSGPDSLASSLRDQTRRAADWLSACGVRVPVGPDRQPQATVEISPLYALDAEELAEKVSEDLLVEPGQQLYLG